MADTEIARKRQKLRQEEEAWAVKQARETFTEFKKQTQELWDRNRGLQEQVVQLTAEVRQAQDDERLCRHRLAIAISRIRDLEERMGIKRDGVGDEDNWIAEELEDAKRSHDGHHKEHQRPGS